MIKFLRTWVLGITILALFAPNTTTLIERIVGIVFIVFLLLPVFLIKDNPAKFDYLVVAHRCKKWHFTLLITLQFIFVNYSSLFYTGSSTLDILSLTLSNENVYGIYQQYFSESNIGNFSLDKIPAILSTFFFKFIFLFICFSKLKTENRKFELFFVILSALIYSSFALSRGTFFEIFEVCIALIFRSVLFSKNEFKFISPSRLLFVGILIFLFFTNTLRRFEGVEEYLANSCITESFCFDSKFYSFPGSYFIYILSTYFSMGIFFISKVVLWMIEENIFIAFPPFLLNSFAFSSNYGLVEGMCNNLFVCKGVWIPEALVMLQLLGIPLLFFFTWIVLARIKTIERALGSQLGTIGLIAMYYLYIFIISLPVGRFWSVSSANIIGTIVVVLIFFLCRVFSFRLRTLR
ncbi:hypothetical protein [Limnobacter alexandrii]|uniref:hypothetical protein n=1 Tax=Limnobacter alexandrii TaxID=2570352 RepID=UPI001108A6CA|nr:hypothetical protein [Limnobacter alexandrii]